MSKIVTAINAMVSNPDKINNVFKGAVDSELFFKYDDKHKWSIMKNAKGEYSIRYYPGSQHIEGLARMPEEAWLNFSEFVSYTNTDLNTKEAQSSLNDLYTIVKEKVYGMDLVLDEIIGDLF